MSTRSENTVTINQPAEKVHEALTTESYWAYIAENLSPEPGEVNEFNGNEVTLFEVLPLDLLPEAVRSMVSQALKVKRVVKISELNDATADINYNADVKGTPVDFSGDIRLTSTGENQTTLTYDNEVSVNIPFMGPAIEPKVADALGDLFTREGELTETWINDNL